MEGSAKAFQLLLSFLMDCGFFRPYPATSLHSHNAEGFAFLPVWSYWWNREQSPINLQAKCLWLCPAGFWPVRRNPSCLGGVTWGLQGMSCSPLSLHCLLVLPGGSSGPAELPCRLRSRRLPQVHPSPRQGWRLANTAPVPSHHLGTQPSSCVPGYSGCRVGLDAACELGDAAGSSVLCIPLQPHPL